MADSEAPAVPFSTSRFMQQTLPACRPFLTPLGSVAIFALFAVVALIFGSTLLSENATAFEQVTRYDEGPMSVTLRVDADLETELFVYYELTNFYQNNFMYGSSKSWDQLEGAKPVDGDLDKCEPRRYQAQNVVLAPCGALPTSVFDDSFTFQAPLPAITDTGIAVPRFAARFAPTNDEYTADSTWLNMSLFPEGQTDERFINWAHMAAFATFRKLWGKTDGPVKIQTGEYRIDIQDNFPVQSFGGTMSIVIAGKSWAGGGNMFLGGLFIFLAGVSIILAGPAGILYITHALPLYKYLAGQDWQ
jgi:hypothetical protein